MDRHSKGILEAGAPRIRNSRRMPLMRHKDVQYR